MYVYSPMKENLQQKPLKQLNDLRAKKIRVQYFIHEFKMMQ